MAAALPSTALVSATCFIGLFKFVSLDEFGLSITFSNPTKFALCKSTIGLTFGSLVAKVNLIVDDLVILADVSFESESIYL